MANSTAIVEKKKKKQRQLEGCPVLSERDQRLIVGFLSAYSIDVETAMKGDGEMMKRAPEMTMFKTRHTRWVNIMSGLKEAMIRAQQRQWWLKGMTPEQLERMET